MSKHPSRPLVGFVAMLVLASCDHNDQSQTRVVEGVVCTAENVSHSYMLTSIYKNDPRLTAVPGATVYLAIDNAWVLKEWEQFKSVAED
jgi:hypothetical protein